MKPVHCCQTFRHRKWKQRMSHWEDSSFSETGLRKLALQVNLFPLRWKDNTMKVGQRGRTPPPRTADVRLPAALCVWERQREDVSGLSRTQQCPHRKCSIGKTAPFNHWPTNLFPTIRCVYPQPNWWLVGLLFKSPADFIWFFFFPLPNRCNVSFSLRCLAWPFVGAPTATRCQGCTCWGSWRSRVSGRPEPP